MINVDYFVKGKIYRSNKTISANIEKNQNVKIHFIIFVFLFSYNSKYMGARSYYAGFDLYCIIVL